MRVPKEYLVTIKHTGHTILVIFCLWVVTYLENRLFTNKTPILLFLETASAIFIIGSFLILMAGELIKSMRKMLKENLYDTPDQGGDGDE